MLGLALWSIALLMIIVRSAGLIAAEKARQTLDILLTTPLDLWDLLGDKMHGLRRVMLLVAVPILCHTLLVSYLQSATGSMRSPYNSPPFNTPTAAAICYVFVTVVNLVSLFALVSQLAFLCGLRAKTQGRAVTFGAWDLRGLESHSALRESLRRHTGGDPLFESDRRPVSQRIPPFGSRHDPTTRDRCRHPKQRIWISRLRGLVLQCGCRVCSIPRELPRGGKSPSSRSSPAT